MSPIMLRSMTAYARAEVMEAEVIVSVEMRSYNSRYLDIALRISPEYANVEDRFRKLFSGELTRGRIEVKVNIEASAGQDRVFEIDSGRADALDSALNRLEDGYMWNIQVTPDFLMGPCGVIRVVQKESDPETNFPIIETCLLEALEGLVTMREKEGQYISEDISNRLDILEKQVEMINEEATGLLTIYQERLKRRIETLTNGVVTIDSGRIAQEAALLADRCDISEEIVRTFSHLKQFREIMVSGEPAGRKLNFLLQEFNREFNTMGAKAGDASVAHRIVEARSEIEKIREQIQNIE